jgi:NAD(P)H-dependent FMN reductase
MDKLKIITSTTRPGRKGLAIANWALEFVQKEGHFDAELLDLGAINLPLLDEPNHPRLKQYQQEHTRQWSAKIDESDAFLIVLAEYNFGFPAPIKNALDYLFSEWKNKPVGFVSYGGISGGLRATQMLKQVVTSLGMMPVVESVAVPMFSKYINDQDQFFPDEPIATSTKTLINEIRRWSEALKTLRQ